MKITLFLLLIGIFQLSAGNVYSQSATITFALEDIPVSEALDKIEQETEFSFFVLEKLPDMAKTVKLTANNSSITQVLDKLFSNTNIQYRIVDKQIILFEKTPVAPVNIQQEGRKITGTVVDVQGEPVIGANIIEKGTSNGVISDIDGKFSITVSENSVLQVSYIGYLSQEIKIQSQSHLNIVLKEDALSLDEVVVVGFGTQKKANLTGAVASVQMDNVLGDRPVTSLGATLQGTIPGLTASSSPIPGKDNEWNIRGLESINGGSPLILVDNVVYNDLYLLNPADIESISVLKDASSAAIYGARASFGVVLITTKKGAKNETLKINYSNNFAFSKVDNLPELTSPSEFIGMLKDAGYTSLWSGQNIETYGGLLQEYGSNPSAYPRGWTEVNGTKYFLKQNPIMGDMFETSWKQTHNVSAQGGSERIKYRLSLGYTDEDGILVTNKDSFRRTTVSGYVSGDITSWLSTSLDFRYNNGIRKEPFVDEKSELGMWKTNLPSYHPMGTLPYGTDGEEYTVMTPSNVIRNVKPLKAVTDNTRILSRTVITPFEGFEGVLEYSYQLGLSDYEAYANYFQVHQGLAESLKPSTSTTPFTTNRESTRYTTLNAFGSYTKTLAKAHNIYVLGGFNQEKSDYRKLESTAYNMISNELPSLSGSDGETPPKTLDKYAQYSMRSAFFRATYNYSQRYFIEMNGRYDLSSKFPKDYRGGFFPSVSAAWSIGNESFMERFSPAISSLKLRASYGTLGNQNVTEYGYYPTMTVENSPWLYNGVVPKTVQAPGMVRANYTWEEVESVNAGLDIGLLNNRLNMTFDIYQRNTTGMLGPSEEFPAVAGAKAPTQNSADLRSRGWELSLQWRDQIRDWKYGVTFNLYDSRTMITRYKNDSGLFYEMNEAQEGKRYRKGMYIGEIWGYVADGFYTAADFDESGALREGVVRISGVTSHEGDIKYKNLRDSENSVNVIDTGDDTADNPGDRKIIGNSQPRFQYGVNGYVSWKGFDLSFMLNGVGKRDAWIGGDITFPMSSQYGTTYKHQLGKVWTENNKENAFYGRMYENAGSSQSANQWKSDKFLYNAAYLRVKNITLSYNIPRKYLQPIMLQGVKVFVSGENLFTFDHLPKGIDPEVRNWSYPHSRTISFGINLNL